MGPVILVVDDEPDLELLVNHKFCRQIRNGDFTFLFASDGKEALSILREQPEVDVVLSDIKMPGMDGLTLLRHLKEFDTRLRAVIVSAYGDMKNIRTAMNLGAFDFVTKPIEFNDLETTIKKNHRRFGKTARSPSAARGSGASARQPVQVFFAQSCRRAI